MEETIELRQIIGIILKGKVVIAFFTIGAILIAGVMSWFVLDEQYESKATVQVAGGVQDTGIMSNYVATEFTPTVYMHRMQNETLMKQTFADAGYSAFNKLNLNLVNQPDSNLVEVTYKAKTAKEAHQHLQLLINMTKNEMNTSVKETLTQLEETYLNESKSLSKEIEQLMTQYNNVITSNNLPEVLILQTITSSEFILNVPTEQTSTLASITGSLQNELLQLKAQIDAKSEEYSNVLNKYQSVKTGIDSFKPDPFVRIISEPTLPVNPSSPNKLLNLVIGLVLGLIIGIGFVFFREYWKNSDIAK